MVNLFFFLQEWQKISFNGGWPYASGTTVYLYGKELGSCLTICECIFIVGQSHKDRMN